MATTDAPAGTGPIAGPRSTTGSPRSTTRRSAIDVRGHVLRVLPRSAACWRSSSGASWPRPACSSSSEATYNSLFGAARHQHDLPVRDAHAHRPRRTTSCRSRWAPRTWPSRASTPCRSGCSSRGGRCSSRARSCSAARHAAGPCYAPLSTHVPETGVNLLVLGLVMTGISSILGSINFLVTIFRLRAPGMGLLRMPHVLLGTRW